MIMNEIKFDEKGLVPAVVQECRTGKVLMVAYMNRESLERTIDTGRSWFYSRSRQELWQKGETSGNIQAVKEIFYDCDGDCLLLKVEQAGNPCHTGNSSCFYRKLQIGEENKETVSIGEMLEKLYLKIMDRRENPVPDSYTCYLFEKGLDKILKKVGEESTEVVIAAKNESKEEVVYEASDLFYHLTVLLSYMGIGFDDIAAELQGRFK
ncbi:MAG: bifunctional phosphoribosyl-AMP cyclohydrolase/phosphoribosyl-ATP diphosphatase HisIE [Caulobacteraceae bacterium]